MKDSKIKRYGTKQLTHKKKGGATLPQDQRTPESLEVREEPIVRQSKTGENSKREAGDTRPRNKN